MQIFLGSHPIDAHFHVETVEGVQTVVFQSRSGNPIRNAEYNEGLELVLRRLGDLSATVPSIVVDSAETRKAGMAIEERLLDLGDGRSYPLHLATETDLGDLRLTLGRSQARIGRDADAAGSGNYTKQIRVYVSFDHSSRSDADLEHALAFGSRILVVALPRSARSNLEWGLENGVWGFPKRSEGAEAERVSEYKTLRRGDRVLLLSDHSGGSPRVPPEAWAASANGEPHRFADCYLCRVNQTYYHDTTPFWPDEIRAQESRYPHRIGIDPLEVGAISLEAGADVSAEVVEAARRSHLQGAQGFAADSTGSPRLNAWPPMAVLDAEGDDTEAHSPEGQGRSVDPIRRRRVEERAMALAWAHYQEEGWTVEDVSRHNDETYGTPYDLRCTKADLIRHVEVKGTSRSGETVRISANERIHAERADPDAESFLFVVEQIGLKTTRGSVEGVGGVVRYHGPFLTEGDRFTATQYVYVVPR